jgi:hypothetical protein
MKDRRAVSIERLLFSQDEMKKKLWTAPVLHTIPIRAALGSKKGSKSDKYGSLSATKH